MAEYSFAWGGTTTGDAGPYTDELFSQFLEEIFNQLTRDNAGVLQDRNDGVNASLDVTITSPASAAVELQIGSAIVQGRYYVNDAAKTLAITANNDGSGFDRIDTVVLELDFTSQTIRSKVVEGTPAGSPVAPTLTQNTSIYQIPLANVTVPNLFVTISGGIDNTVRSYAQLLDWREGGTGFSSYSIRELLVGKSDGSLGKTYRSKAEVYYNTTGATMATGSWQTMELLEGNDPDSLISISANQITFAKRGWYGFSISAPLENPAGAGTRVVLRLRDITNTATLSSITPPLVGTSRVRWSGNSRLFQIQNDNDVVQLQAFADVGNFRWANDTLPVGSGETLYAMIGKIIYFGET